MTTSERSVVDALDNLTALVDQVAQRLNPLFPKTIAPENWQALAYRWRVHSSGFGYLEAITRPQLAALDALQGIDHQRDRLLQNTRQFVAGLPANHALLTGARGCGKSSLVRSMLTQFADQGLRLIEVERDDMVALPDIVDLVRDRPEHFIIYCDDLSFETGEKHYKALKAILEGSVAAVPENILLYATSNRKHLLPEYMSDNVSVVHQGDEIHPGEGIDEAIALSDRFGLWLSFYPFTQDFYWQAVSYWLKHYGVPSTQLEQARQAAMTWSIARGVRNGRTAQHFSRDWAGKMRLASLS